MRKAEPTYQRSLSEARGFSKKYININKLLGIILCWLLYQQNFSHSSFTVEPPPTIGRPTVRGNVITDEEKKSWGTYIARLSGNIRSNNVEFVFETLRNMSEPNSRATYEKAVKEQIKIEKTKKIVETFVINSKRTVFHRGMGRLWVTGIKTTTIPSGDEYTKI